MIQFVSLGSVGAAQADDWIRLLHPNLREADVAEIAAMTGLSPEEALRTSVHYSSHGWVILDSQAKPISIFGAAPSGVPGAGLMWMVGTEGIRRNASAIARNTRPYLEEMNRAYPILWNHVDARNAVSIRWLQWAGCRVIGEDPFFGPERRLFYVFARMPD